MSSKAKASQLDPHFLPQHLPGGYEQCAGGLKLTADELTAMQPALARTFGLPEVPFPQEHARADPNEVRSTPTRAPPPKEQLRPP